MPKSKFWKFPLIALVLGVLVGVGLFLVFPKPSNLTVVTRVIDGDTVEISGGQRVRLIGIDTPETRSLERNLKNAMRLGVDPQIYESYAAQAKAFVEDLALHQTVRLEYDEANQKNRHRDKYGRLLAYLWLESPFLTNVPDWAVMSQNAPEDVGHSGMGDEGWGMGKDFSPPESHPSSQKFSFSLNASLIKSGHAFAYVRFPFKYQASYVQHESSARAHKRGYWRAPLKPINQKVLIEA